MLSLAILLLLMVGMNVVFRTTSDTVKAGQMLNELTRNSRAVRPVFFDDLRNCATDSPCFIISSCIVPQYVNAADANASSSSGLPTSGCLLGSHMHRADQLSFFVRGLFKRKTANNPTTNGPNFLNSNTTSDEAYVHYGHLRMLSSDGLNYIGPDDVAFGNQQPYAADWVLGRNQILMNDGANLLDTNAKDLSSPGDPEAYYSTSSPAPAAWPSAAANVVPLGSWTTPYVKGGSAYNPFPIISASNPVSNSVQTSRYDLAGVTIEQFRSILTQAATAQAGQALTDVPYYAWWAPLVYEGAFDQVNATVWKPNIYATNFVNINPNTGKTGSPPTTVQPLRNRFQGSNSLGVAPFAFNANYTSSGALPYEGASDEAQFAPIFLEHVSQFIVEYAGDFVTQAAPGNTAGITSGEVTNTVPDGQIDWVYASKGLWSANTTYYPGDYVLTNANAVDTFYINNSGQSFSGTSNNPKGTNQTPTGATAWTAVSLASNLAPPKAIRWYGMPRDAMGSGFVTANPPGRWSLLRQLVTSNELNNVVPLADVWTSSGANNANNAATTPLPVPYEVESGPTLFPGLNTSAAGVAQVANYSATGTTAGNQGLGYNTAHTSSGVTQARYTAVWRNDVPAMVRILIKLDDPNNTLADGPWFEYVFKLK